VSPRGSILREEKEKEKIGEKERKGKGFDSLFPLLKFHFPF
jgi:hypothetical protein